MSISEQKMIQFELVSPEEKLVSEPVKMAVLPSINGEIGVGASHSAFVVQLGRGVVKLYDEKDAVTRRYFIADGFVDITNESCTVLAEQAVVLEDLDKPTLEVRLSELEALIKEADNEGYPDLFAEYKLVSSKLEALSSVV